MTLSWLPVVKITNGCISGKDRLGLGDSVRRWGSPDNRRNWADDPYLDYSG
jgi:hypothetical protein